MTAAVFVLMLLAIVLMHHKVKLMNMLIEKNGNSTVISGDVIQENMRTIGIATLCSVAAVILVIVSGIIAVGEVITNW